MTRRPIGDPQPGERLLDVVTEPGAEARSCDHRLNLFSGRALSEVALQSQQKHWQNRLRQLAQLRSPGVVRGLEVSEEQPHTADKWLHVNPGLGLSADGEDVWLPRPARLRFSALPDLSRSPTTQAADPDSPDPRRLWILVLRPVSVLEADAADPNRCNEWDESGRAFEQETRRDGTQLGRFPLDLPLPMEGEGQFQASLEGHAGGVFGISLSPDGTGLASGGADGSVRLWTLESGRDAKPRARLRGHEGEVNSVSWSPDGRRLASGSADATIRLWTLDSESGSEQQTVLKGHDGGVNSISWSPDGSRLASGGADGSVRLWSGDSESGAEPLAVLEGHEGGVNSIGWSPDGKLLASGGADGTVRLWSGESEGGSEPLAVLQGHEAGVSSISWGPEGTVLASGSADASVRLWSRESASDAEPLALLKGGLGAVSCVGWSPDGKQLASGGADGTVQLWSGDGASSAEPLRVLGGHRRAVTSLAWSADGQQVVSGGADGLLLVSSVTATEGNERWRNLLAHELFGWEQRAREQGQSLPWESAGVPLALIALTADRQQIAFVDSAAVVRQGGRPREVMPLLPGSLPASLARARLRQFAEQMAELPPIGARSAGEGPQWMGEVVVPSFRHLPPFGLLPRAALGDLQLQAVQPSQSRDDVRSGLTTKDCLFFPQSWQVHLAAIPQEQLELVLRDSTTLAPFDLEQPDQVQLWVPVPQSLYEPDLLLEESVDGIFQQKIETFTAVRNDWLQRRAWLRRRLAALTRAISGKPVLFPKQDPGQVEVGELTEDETADAPDLVAGPQNTVVGSAPTNAQPLPPEEDYGTTFDGAESKRDSSAVALIRSQLLSNSPIDTDAEILLPKDPKVKLPEDAIESIQQDLASLNPSGKFTYNPADGLLKIDGIMTAEEQKALVTMFNKPKAGAEPYFDPKTVTEAIGALKTSSSDNNALLSLDPGSGSPTFTGLESFIQQLEQKTAQADDSIEFGFLQVRTNMYRIRQQVMGREEALKLATSPTLAAIAERESASASQEDLKNYFQRIKSAPLPQRGLSTTEAAVARTSDTSARGAGATGEVAAPGGRPAAGPAPAEGATARAVNLDNIRLPENRLSFGDRFVSPTATFTDATFTSAKFTGALEKDVTLFQSEGFQRLDPRGDPPIDILRQAPVVGRALGTISVAERLKQPAAVGVSDFALNDQVSVLDGLSRQGLLKDLLVPGRPGETFGRLQPGKVVNPSLPPNPTEADYFSNAVRTLDLTVASLRLAEGRVEQYRQAIARCKETLQEILQQQGRLEARLRVVDNELAEARQDVSVAQSLLAEETARVNAINARRRRTLKDQVPFLAFQRPRSLELRHTPPWIPLDPGPGADPLPPCLNDTTPIPREVRAMVELLREAPLGWFNALLPELRRMDRIDTLVRLFNSAAQRRGAIAPSKPPPLGSSEGSASPIGRSINRLYGQRQQLLRQGWLSLPPEAQQAVAGQTWQESLRLAERSLTLGDLLAGDHRRPELTSQAAALLDQWCRVAACLKERFAAIAPQLRLDWAERLSQFDGPVNLRVLTNLPLWGEVRDPSQRRSLQSLVDWLFQQVNGTEEQATAFANDLVRLSLLLACHAPVNQILSGQLIGTPSLAPEARLPIRMDPLQVRIGMPVLFHGRGGVVAQGIVEDLSGTVATARILQGNANLSADNTTRVQFLRQSFL
jgi:WD40 repeat protein